MGSVPHSWFVGRLEPWNLERFLQEFDDDFSVALATGTCDEPNSYAKRCAEFELRPYSGPGDPVTHDDGECLLWLEIFHDVSIHVRLQSILVSPKENRPKTHLLSSRARRWKFPNLAYQNERFSNGMCSSKSSQSLRPILCSRISSIWSNQPSSLHSRGRDFTT